MAGGVDRLWKFGPSVAGIPRFRASRIHHGAAFDINPAVIGTSIGGLTVDRLENLEFEVRKQQIKVGMIAVPASAAQSVAERLAAYGVSGILNFAPITLDLPPTANVIEVDLAIELEQLSYAVVTEMRKG